MRTLPLVAAALTTAVASADGPPTILWQEYWDPGDGLTATAGFVEVDDDGNVYSVVAACNATLDIAVIKYGVEGDVLWSLQYDGPGQGNDAVTDIELTDEGLAILGASPGEDGPETVLLNYDGDGNLLWEHRTLGPSIPGFLRPQLAIDADGNRIIGTDEDGGAARVRALSEDGRILWTQDYQLAGFAGVSALEVDSVGDVYVVTVESFDRYFVRKISAAGAELWSHAHVAPNGLVLGEAFIAPMEGGEVVIVGSPEIPCVTVKAQLWRHDASGDVLWSTVLPEDECDFGIAIDMVPSGDGAVYLAANGTLPTSFLTRIASNGDIDWTIEASDEEFRIGFVSLAVAPSGNVIAGVRRAPLGNISENDLGVQCYTPDGELEYSFAFAGPDDMNDSMSDVAVGSGGAFAGIGTIRHTNPIQNALTMYFAGVTCDGDLDGDAIVGASDLLVVLGAWGPNEGHPADLNGDGFVSAADLLLLLGAWGTCVP